MEWDHERNVANGLSPDRVVTAKQEEGSLGLQQMSSGSKAFLDVAAYVQTTGETHKRLPTLHKQACLQMQFRAYEPGFQLMAWCKGCQRAAAVDA